jgi:surface antigen
MKTLVVALASLVALGACSQGPGGGYKQPVGTLAGGALGGLAGAQIGGGTGKLAATAAGALLGAVVGNDIGGSLDRADAAYYGRNPGPGYYAAAPAPSYYATGQGYAVPAYGGGGTVTPVYTPTQAPILRSTSGCRPVGNGIWCD